MEAISDQLSELSNLLFSLRSTWINSNRPLFQNILSDRFDYYQRELDITIWELGKTLEDKESNPEAIGQALILIFGIKETIRRICKAYE